MEANRLYKGLRKAEAISNTFGPFAAKSWIFEASKANFLMDSMDEVDRQIFCIDVAKIEWRPYYITYNWGMHRYILGENVEPPFPDESLSTTTNVLSKYKEKSR